MDGIFSQFDIELRILRIVYLFWFNNDVSINGFDFFLKVKLKYLQMKGFIMLLMRCICGRDKIKLNILKFELLIKYF